MLCESAVFFCDLFGIDSVRLSLSLQTPSCDGKGRSLRSSGVKGQANPEGRKTGGRKRKAEPQQLKLSDYMDSQVGVRGERISVRIHNDLYASHTFSIGASKSLALAQSIGTIRVYIYMYIHVYTYMYMYLMCLCYYTLLCCQGQLKRRKLDSGGAAASPSSPATAATAAAGPSVEEELQEDSEPLSHYMHCWMGKGFDSIAP